MIKDREGINEINKVCKAVLKLQDSDFEEVEKMYKEQEGYVHPLTMATAGRQHALGEYNRKVVEALKSLRDTIKDGAAI